MLPTQKLRTLSTLTALLLVHAASWALGLGDVPSSVMLGRPLDIAVPLRLEPGEEVGADCVQAEVWHGDQRVSPDAVRVRINPGNAGASVLRIRTSTVIEEPTVSLQLTVGCTTRVQRRYVMLADPGPATPAPMAVVATPAVAAAPVATSTSSERSAAAVVSAGVGAALPATPPSTRPQRPPRSSAATAQSATAPASRPREPRRRASNDASPRPPARRPAEAAPTAADPRPRLKLDPSDAVAVAATAAPAASAIQQALEAVTQAASAARASADAASAATVRARALEQELGRLRAQASASQAEFDRLQTLAARSDQVSLWVWPLLALLLFVVLLAAWMAWRMRGLRQSQELAWLQASTLVAQGATVAPPSPTSPLPLVTSELTQPAILTGPESGAMTRGKPAGQATVSATGGAPPEGVRPSAGRGEPARSGPESPTESDIANARTQPMPPTFRVERSVTRDVSIEELIDIDQQAEFFIALGQDQAAIDLLVSHLRETGGGSPLPYLKLLEIYAGRNDQAAYERTRSRFNHRFNAYAPEWGSDLSHGRSLEDYPDVLPRVVAAWSRPLDAMAELEALLFRKSQGELFDLPAYRDVLFLYALAREYEQQDARGEPVDLLLPLDLQTELTRQVGDARATSDVPPDERPTAPLDLDLDLTPASTASIFGAPLVPTGGRGEPPRR